MTKLVSRNPILRFKEGRKIVKAYDGTYLGIPVHKYQSTEGIKYGYRDPKTGKLNSVTADKLDTGRKYSTGTMRGMVYIGADGNMYQNGRRGLIRQEKKVEKKLVSTDDTKSSKSDKAAGRGTATPVVKSTPTSFMGQGIQQGWRGIAGKTPELTDLLKLQLINTGKFTDNDFTTARALQTALNNYFGGTVGSISVDNKWGSLSQKALDAALAATKDPGMYMNLSLSLDLPNLDGTKTRTNIHGRYNITGLLSNNMTNPENIPTINLTNASPAITPQVSNVNLNRAQTRDLMRAHNLNPYDYSGAQRKALRNFYSTGNYDSNLLNGIISKDYKWLKKGGLISRNPVKQFKSNFRKEAL